MTATSARFFHLSLTGPAFGRLEEAEQFYLAGNLNEALAAAQQAWREHPTDADVFRVLAYIHMARGEYPPAAQAAYQSVKVDENNAASYATLAQVYLTFNMISNARETIDAARRRFPGDAALLVLAADLQFRSRQEESAARLAQEALAINPQDGYAKSLLGVHFLRKKKYRPAEEYLAEAVRSYPSRWDYQRDYGIALLHNGQADASRTVLSRALALNPSDDSTRQHLWYALGMAKTTPPPFMPISFFFFNHTAFGWLLNILGMVAAITGVIWVIIALTSALMDSKSVFGVLDAIKYGALTLAGGIALILLTGNGIMMRTKRGRRFDIAVRKELAKVEGENL